jgi:hypothetical protein
VATIVAALLAALGAPGGPELLAQNQASRIERRGETGDRNESRVLQRFARCFIDDNPGAAAALVDPPVGSVDRGALIARHQGALNRCLGILGGGEMSPSRWVMLGVLAEQLYVRRFAQLPPLAPPPAQSVADPERMPIQATWLFANCLIDRNATAVDRLLRSQVGSRGEDEAYAALSAHYGGCLDTGSAMRLNRLALRTSLADQLYRRAIAGAAAAPPPPGG